jgi:hypothetical protein
MPFASLHLDQVFLSILIALIAIAIFIAIQVAVARRRTRLAAWARARGFEFTPFHDGDFPYRHSGFECFNKGSSRYADNVAQGRIGPHKVCAFDYHYTTGSSERQGSRHFSGVVVTTNLPLKPLWIRHETIFDRVASLVGLPRVEFESAAFNREFHVASADRRWAFDVLPQSTIEFLLDSPKFTLEFQLCQILARREGLLDPKDFDSAIAVIEGILRRLPASLLQELQGVER